MVEVYGGAMLLNSQWLGNSRAPVLQRRSKNPDIDPRTGLHGAPRHIQKCVSPILYTNLKASQGDIPF